MRKKKKWLFLSLIIILISFISGCSLIEGEQIDSLYNKHLYNQVMEEVNNFDGVVQIESKVKVMLDEIQVESKTLVYNVGEKIKFVEESMKLNEDPYGDLYVTTKKEEEFELSDGFGKLNITRYLEKSNFVNEDYEIIVNDNGLTFNAKIKKEVAIELLTLDSDEVNNLSNCAITVTSFDGKISSYMISYSYLNYDINIITNYFYS